MYRETHTEKPPRTETVHPFLNTLFSKWIKHFNVSFFNMVLILWNQGKKGKKKNPINDQVKMFN